MKAYLELLKLTLLEGERKPTRAILPSTGNHVSSSAVFGHTMKHDMSTGLPLLTTKFLPFKQIVTELIWFIKGSTNTAYLKTYNVTIWNEWADKDGNLGPVYGKQWRRWQSPAGHEIDQLAEVQRDILTVKRNPTASCGRRLIVLAWNPADVPQMNLPPCHLYYQFSVTNGRLDMLVLLRSADIFLGVPFNLASYGILLSAMAQTTQLKPGILTYVFADLHLYENHQDQAILQLTRVPKKLPTLRIDPSLTDITKAERDHFEIEDYLPEAGIKGEVAV